MIAKQPDDSYCSYFNYAVRLGREDALWNAVCIYSPLGRIAEAVTVCFVKGEKRCSFSDFEEIQTEYERSWNGADCRLNINLTGRCV